MSECTYNRTKTGILRTIEITTLTGGQFIVTDTEDCKIASMAFAEFRRGGVMYILVDDEEYYVPSSAVAIIKVTEISNENE